jgi:hypothetical protein
MIHENIGHIIVKTDIPPQLDKDNDELLDRLYKLELYLNGTVGVDVYKKFGVSIRVCLAMK